jgi:hypothetical protein
MNTTLMRPGLLSVSALALVLMLCAQTAHAQVRGQASVDLTLGVPTGEFGDNIDHPGFGLDLSGGIGLGPAPIQIGLAGTFLIYGIESRSEPFSTTIPDVRVDVETTNSIVMGHLYLRIQPTEGVVQPYAEGLFGFKYLFTSTSIKNRGSGEEVASSTNFDDIAASYGFGGGLDFRVYNGVREDGGRKVVLVHLGARYLLGGNAEYLKRGSIRRENGEVTYGVSRSRTDLIQPQLGVTFQF